MDYEYGGGRGGRSYPGRVRPRRRRWGRIILATLAALLALLLVGGIFVYFSADAQMERVDALPDYDGRPEDSPGENWLLVGSDSRKGLSKKERAKLHTGKGDATKRTDSMMLVHLPEGDAKPTLVSLPRDSYVPIPGRGRNKLNAAYSFGGGKLLSRTVEQVTDIRIDHYMEIGFGGFVEIVDALGGVEIDVKENLEDERYSGLKLKKGKQTLDGATALKYVRTRHGTGDDFGRVQRQRQFLGAVLKGVSSPWVVINPFKSIPLAYAAADTLKVDEGTALIDLPGVGFALGGDTQSGTVPVAGTPTMPGAGSVVQWDKANATRLFKALKEDQPVTKDMLKREPKG